MTEILSIRDIVDLVIGFLRGMWRHRWHMVVVAWLVSAAGWTVVFLMEDQYISQGRVMVDDPQGTLRPYLPTTIDITVEAQKILGALKNRDNLTQVVQRSDLAKQIKGPEDLEMQIGLLSNQISVLPKVELDKSLYYLISCKHTNPVVAQQVVKILLEIVFQGSIKRMTAVQSRKTQSMLDEQIKTFEADVAEAKVKLRNFTKEHHAYLPGPGGFYDQLQSWANQIEREKSRMREVEKKREELMRQMSSLGSTATSNTPETHNQHIEQRIRELNVKLEERRNKSYIKGGQKRSLYPDDHPEILMLKRGIAALEQQKSGGGEGSARSGTDAPPTGMDNDPVYRQIKIALNEVNAELATITSRLDEFKSKMEEMQLKEASLPSVETDYIRLQRHLGMVTSNLSNLVKSEGDVKYAGEMAEHLSEKVSFLLVENPAVPSRPVAPNRMLFNGVVLAGGLVAGMVMSLFLAIIRPVFDNPISLKKELGLPVLGTVAMVGGIYSRPRLLWMRFGFLIMIFLLLGFFLWMNMKSWR